MFALKDTLVEKGKYPSGHTKIKTVFEPQREKTTTKKKTKKHVFLTRTHNEDSNQHVFAVYMKKLCIQNAPRQDSYQIMRMRKLV